eukprot:jgi/Ulvmu1/340/UM001_0344.1
MFQPPAAATPDIAAPGVLEQEPAQDHDAGRSDRMASALTCPILDEPFTVEGKYRPYVLPCGHTISRQALEQILHSTTPRCPMDMSDLPHAFLHGYKINYALVDAIMASSGYKPSYSGSRPESQSSGDGKSPQRIPGVITLRPFANTDAVISPRLRQSRDLSGIAEISTAAESQHGAASQLSSDDSPAWRGLMREYGLEQQGLSIADVEAQPCSTSRTGQIYKGTLVAASGVRSAVSIKVLPTVDEAEQPSQRLREVARQEALDHCRWMARLRTSIMPVRAVQDDAAGGRVRIVTDLHDITLAQWMKRYPEGRLAEQEWLTMALQLTECVHSWHAAGCVHYEICPATVVRSSAYTIRLTKLGCIDRYPACKAPEQLENVFIQSSAYTSAVDVWALGVTLLHAWTGRQPCAGQHEAQIMQRMRAGDSGVLRDLGHSDMRHELQTILQQCMALDPGERPTSEAVHAQLQAVHSRRMHPRFGAGHSNPDTLYEPAPSCCTIM